MVIAPYIKAWEASSDGSEPQWFAVFALQLSACASDRASGEQAAKQRFRDQVDFINSLFGAEPPRTLALRYIVRPDPDSVSAGRVDVVLLGKVSDTSEAKAYTAAHNYFREITALVGGFMPDHVWEIVADASEFHLLWEPFPWVDTHCAEIRRRTDQVNLKTVRPRPSLGRSRSQPPPDWEPDDTVYLVHQFKARSEPLDRLLRALLLFPAPIVWQVNLMPVRLGEKEEQALVDEIGKCERYLTGNGSQPLIGDAQTLHRHRASVFCEMLVDQLVRLQDAPYLINIGVASPQPLPHALLEIIGVSITEPVTGEGGSGGYDVVYPAEAGERTAARENIEQLDFQLWGKEFVAPPLKRLRTLVDALEAAGAFRLPLASDERPPGIDVRIARFRGLPREIAELAAPGGVAGRLYLGQNRYLGMPHEVFLPEKDRRQHMYAIGQTGTGKTTFLKTLIKADMEAGNGLAVIDPHGDLFDELLAMIPPERVDDVVVFDPMDDAFPVGLNMLECTDESQRHFIVREMRAIMERLIDDQYDSKASEYAGPVFYQHMQMNMLLAMSNPEDPGTLLELYEIFQHKDYWRHWLPLKWTESQLSRWVDTTLPQLDYTERHSEGLTFGEYISSKFDDFVFDPRLRAIFGQKRSTINFREIMDDGKILLVNLAKGDLTEANARFLGMVLMAKIQAAAMERSNIPVHERRMFYLYVDEFQSIATENFTLMLSEARKFGLGLTLANQFLSQIKDQRIIQSVFGNVGTVASFRVGHEDAKLLEPHFLPDFDTRDLTNLPNWTACIKTTVSGQVVSPFTLNTVASDESTDSEKRAVVLEASRKKYGRPAKDVAREIEESFRVEKKKERRFK